MSGIGLTGGTNVEVERSWVDPTDIIDEEETELYITPEQLSKISDGVGQTVQLYNLDDLEDFDF